MNLSAMNQPLHLREQWSPLTGLGDFATSGVTSAASPGVRSHWDSGMEFGPTWLQNQCQVRQSLLLRLATSAS